MVARKFFISGEVQGVGFRYFAQWAAAKHQVRGYIRNLEDGRVESLAAATGARFSLLPPDNATGNFTKVVQRIAVKIVIDDADGLADRLVPGMSVEAKVNARDGARK